MAADALATIEYRDEPALFVFADTEIAAARACRAARLACCRVAAAVPLAEAEARLDAAAAAPPALVEVDAAVEPPSLAPLLDRLRGEADGGRPSVIVAPAGLLDLVAARGWHPAIAHLCNPTEAERIAAVAAAARPEPPRLNDVGREGQAVLQQLSEEVGRIATILASLSEEEAAELGAIRSPGPAAPEEPPIDANYVRTLIRARRLREQYFRSDLFADPAWDMLLDLMAARLEKNRVAVSSLCIAAAVPATTALRWIKALTDRGLFIRAADPEDGRRVYIELSDDTARALAAYLHAVQRIAPLAV